MSKYNITENKQQRPAAYRTTVSPEVMDELQRKVIQKIVVEKCYRDKNYSARQLAQDLGTNTRYISAVVNNRFHKNYTELVNGYRVEADAEEVGDKKEEKEEEKVGGKEAAKPKARTAKTGEKQATGEKVEKITNN